MHSELANKVFGDDFELIKQVKGKELEHLRYEALFDYASDIIKMRKAFVCCDEYVTASDGTEGIVHIAPAFGEDDARIGRKYNLPFVQLVKDDGCLPDEVYDFANQFCKVLTKILQNI